MGEPRQAGVIAVRQVEGDLQVCLIRKRTAARWGIPKGFIECGDWRQAALEEAQEEAGLHGPLRDEAAGTYDYEKGPVTLTVVVGIMDVSEAHDSWREMFWRERRWCSLDEADVLLAHHPVSLVFRQIRSRLER